MYHPLMFRFGDTLAGNGFFAKVALTGHALMLQEGEGDWWLYGVCPGAIAERGKTPQEAYLRFRNRYKELLFDVAEESPDFDTFKQEIERFLSEKDEDEERRWVEALQAIRTGDLGLEAPFSELPRERPENWPCQASVQRIDEPREIRATDNVPDSYAIPVAA